MYSNLEVITKLTPINPRGSWWFAWLAGGGDQNRAKKRIHIELRWKQTQLPVIANVALYLLGA